jgi:hypothetical protein
MKTFIDKTGQPWDIDLTVGHLLNIKTEMGLNLMDEPETIPDQVEKIVGILWITCFDQAKQLGLGPIDFAKRLDGKVLQEAFDKWMEEWTDFFVHQSPSRGQLIKGMWDQARRLDQARAELIKQACSSTSFDWPESATSTPGLSKDG